MTTAAGTAMAAAEVLMAGRSSNRRSASLDPRLVTSLQRQAVTRIHALSLVS